MPKLHPVILCGGSGTRLWPLSRNAYPKQFMDIGGDTLFSQAVARAARLPDSMPPLVICNEEHRFFAAALLEGHFADGRNTGNAARPRVLLEPSGRNTAPAVALAAFAAQEASPAEDPLLLILSSDHVLAPHGAFAAAIAAAVPAAEKGALAVFGVVPTRPETGYGYIRQGEELHPGVFAVDSFIEKPDKEKAEALLRQGKHYWNSGIFLFRASVFLRELDTYAPELYAACRDIWEGRRRDYDFTRFSPEAFSACPSVSIDYAVMEHTGEAAMVPLALAWNDMGTWQSFYESADKDAEGNACVGDVVQMGSRGCYLHSSNKLVTAVGLENICLVETADAVLALPRERSQEVKLLLGELTRRGRKETHSHIRVYRPWGSYETLALGERFQVKSIIVTPGSALSLQMHHHRAEHWVVVRGRATVTNGENVVLLGEDQSTYIPQGTKHRLENAEDVPLEIIEIQTGSYLGEDDIVRFEDNYGRLGERAGK